LTAGTRLAIGRFLEHLDEFEPIWRDTSRAPSDPQIGAS
jgi:hypothetical protein